MKKNERGVVYLEMLIGFLPVFMFFLGTLQVADLSAAHLVVEHAATTAARAAVVVLPDDGAYYEDVDNAAVDEFRDYRQSDVERAADTILAANPRLDLSSANVALDKPKYEERELVTAQVTAPYRCLVPIFCPGGVTITADAQLVYQGAHYIYEPSTGWASSAANRGLENIKNKVSDWRDKKKQEGDPNKPKPDDEETKPDVDDDPTNDAANQKKVDDLKKALPPKLRDVPIKVDPSLPGSTVRVHYTHDDKGRITGIEVRVGPDAQARHIQDHVPTIKAMQRYQGAAGKARALAQRFKNWLTGNPNAGPGTLAWETHREVEKLTGILENRAKQLEDPNLTDAQRKELERELDSYEKQLAHHEKVLEDVTNEPGRGYVAANAEGRTGREEAQHRYGPDVPDPPEGYHWSLNSNGDPIVARDRKKDDEGNPRPTRRFDPDAEPDPSDPFAQWPERTVVEPRFRTDDAAIRGEHPPTDKAVKDRAAARQKVKLEKANAKTRMKDLAAKANVQGAIEKSNGAEIIAEERRQAVANNDKVRIKLLDKLAAEQKKYKELELQLQQESEQLGNAMAESYMKAEHGDYDPKYPPPSTDGYTPGKRGEFDYVYTQGDPPTSIIIVEAKGGQSDLGTGAGGTASQGSPEYMEHIAQQMYEKEPDKNSPAAKLWESIIKAAQGDADAPEVRYITVQAPVSSNGDPRAGVVREFDLSAPPPDPDPSTNP